MLDRLEKQKMFSEYINSDGSFKPEFYNEDYYERGKESGRGWLENYHLMPERSIRESFAFIDYMGLDSQRDFILDFGCAKGFLVWAFRFLGYKAEGCDISDYALSFAPDGCWNCATLDSWRDHELRYSHIVCKDVFEHIEEKTLFSTLRGLTMFAPKMMCVIPMGDHGKYRIPEYHMEISHVIIENEIWWEDMFIGADWNVIKHTNHVPGLKDNWMNVPDGNHVFVLEAK